MIKRVEEVVDKRDEEGFGMAYGGTLHAGVINELVETSGIISDSESSEWITESYPSGRFGSDFK